MFTPPLLTFIRNSPYCVYKNTDNLNNGLWSSSEGLYKLHRPLCLIRAVGLPTPTGSRSVGMGEVAQVHATASYLVIGIIIVDISNNDSDGAATC